MLSHEVTMALISQAKEGDKTAMERLVEENKPLLKSLVKRYVGKSVEYEDLMQIASIGLIKAVKNFSNDFGVRFSTYAVPMVLGEVKRFVRDDGYVKISRSIKSLAMKVNRYIDDYRKSNADEPTLMKIAEDLHEDVNDVAFALDSSKMPVSLFEKANDSDEKSQELIERLPDGENFDPTDGVMLKGVLAKLGERERLIIVMRYFRDLTQSEIAQKLGISQVQVSRLENRILEKMRSDLSK